MWHHCHHSLCPDIVKALFFVISSAMASPSVLVVRSTCLSSLKGSQDQEKVAHTHDHDNHDGNLKNHNENVLEKTLHLLPVTCDILVLPEIPVDSQRHVTMQNEESHDYSQDHSLYNSPQRHVIRMDRQELHPCGLDNVLLLQDLPPTADPASYLLSLSSCGMRVSQVEVSSKRPIDIAPFVVPIQAVPSTFSFTFQTHSGKHSTGQNGVVVNPTRAAAELNVVFDFSLALNHFEQVWNEYEEAMATEETVTTTTETTEEQNNKSPIFNRDMPPVLMDKTKMAECSTNVLPSSHYSHHHHHHDHLLHVIRELAEKEAQHLDYMLVGLGLVFVLLVVHYARTVVPLIRSKRSSASRKKTSVTSQVTGLVEKSGIHGNRPPVKSVAFRRSDASQKNFSQEKKTTFSTDNGVAASPSAKAPFVLSESTIGMAETSSLSSASALEMKQFTFLPNSPDHEKKNALWNKENMGGNAQVLAGRRELSPCSKLAQRWAQTKEQRRVSRVGSHEVISPVAEIVSPKLLVPEEGNQVGNRRLLSLEMMIPTLSRHSNDENNFNTKSGQEQVSPRPFDSLGRKAVTPETCPISEESFLQDYWGE